VTFEDAHVPQYRDPPGVERAAPGKDMMKMLLDGELDAAIFGGNIPSDPRLKSVIAEPEAAAKEWYKKHATVPVNHMVVVKSALAKSDPGAVREIFRMLQAGKKAAGLPKPGAIDTIPFGFPSAETGARIDVELRAGNENHPATIFGRGIVRRRHAGSVGLDPGGLHSRGRKIFPFYLQ
jgi:4,5-dihydroxyphthalate decarboxylase